jgi:hypothetical protein
MTRLHRKVPERFRAEAKVRRIRTKPRIATPLDTEAPPDLSGLIFCGQA